MASSWKMSCVILVQVWNIPFELLIKDFSKTNYSSAARPLLEAWRYFSAQRQWLATYWARDLLIWIVAEEAINKGVMKPSDFMRTAAWTRCKWIGPGRGWADPVKEAKSRTSTHADWVFHAGRWNASQGLIKEVLNSLLGEKSQDHGTWPNDQWCQQHLKHHLRQRDNNDENWNCITGDPWAITETALQHDFEVAVRENEAPGDGCCQTRSSIANSYNATGNVMVAWLFPWRGRSSGTPISSQPSAVHPVMNSLRVILWAPENPQPSDFLLDIDPGGEVNGVSELASMILRHAV